VAFISPSFFNEYNKRFMPLFSTTYIAILARMGRSPKNRSDSRRKVFNWSSTPRKSRGGV
jgi:hypothetical protein